MHLRDLAGADAKRWQHFHIEHDDWLLDISRQRITQQTLSLLLESGAGGGPVRSHRSHVPRRSDQYHREARGAAHGAALGFRRLAGHPSRGQGLAPEIQGTSSPRCAAASKLGVTGKKFRHVVNIGIGGSDLGPLLVCDALRAEWSGDITPHFVSNVDRTQLEDLMRTHRSGGDAGHRVLQDLRHAGDADQRQCGTRLDRRRARREGRRAITSWPCRPMRRRWTSSASLPIIASPCGIGSGAAIRCGPPSA